MKDIREYEFELVKIKGIIDTKEDVEIYLKMINLKANILYQKRIMKQLKKLNKKKIQTVTK